MKKLTFLMAALLVAMTGCQKEPAGNGTEAAEGKVYMSFSVHAVDTKSATDGTGDSNSDATPETEVGSDAENKISTVQVILDHSTTDNFIESSEVTLSGGLTNYTATFKKGSFTPGEYKVYIVCNDKLSGSSFDSDAVKSITTDGAGELNISTDNNFLMTNARTASPINITDAMLTAGMSPATPIQLGTIEVERTVARFDYAAENADHLYTIKTGEKTKIKLSHAALVNVSKEAYYFRRVYDGSTTVGGVETSTNWVEDTDWTIKTTLKGTWNNATAEGRFNYPLMGAAREWIDLTALSVDDNIDGSITDTHPDPDVVNSQEYHFLSYVSENTLPNAEAQINGLSTGVVFKGYLTTEDGTALLTGADANDYKYVFANTFYGSFSEMNAACGTGTTDFKAAFDQIKATPTDLAKCVAAGFTVYTPDANKNYEVLYYYWNRHNDNYNSKNMGTMEFAVVRNNVYKLMVNSISKYGHPSNTAGDPDPIDPSNPDEEAEYYFRVYVKVLPWTVRVNNIEF